MFCKFCDSVRVLFAEDFFGWMVYPNYLQTKSEDSAVCLSELIFCRPGQLNSRSCQSVTD